MAPIPGFKPICTIIGVIYIFMASSMLATGPGALRDFGVPEDVITAPVLQDFFSFFYQLMAFLGVLMVLFGHVTRERNAQLLVAIVFCITNLLVALRDLSTSDSQLGNHLYKGEKTIAFVVISLTIAASFGYLIVRGLGNRRTQSLRSSQPL